MSGRREVTAPGHGPRVWAPTLRRAPALRLPHRLTGLTVLVASAHPDDETLGAGGLIGALRARGARFVFVVATDGAAALPGLAADGRADLAATRRREARAALTALGVPEPAPHFLDLPDGAADRHVDAVAARLADLGAGAALWLAPWRHDPHPDHRAVGQAAARAAGPARLLEYPVWMRHGMLPRDVARDGLRVHRMARGQRIRKRRAIDAHASQVGVWDDAHDPVLPPAVTTLFRGGDEPVFVDGPVPVTGRGAGR